MQGFFFLAGKLWYTVLAPQALSVCTGKEGMLEGLLMVAARESIVTGEDLLLLGVGAAGGYIDAGCWWIYGCWQGSILLLNGIGRVYCC